MHPFLGIADSGSGGLSVRQSIVSLLPRESTLYVGDHVNLPYSRKSTRFIRSRMRTLISYLISRRSKLIILACNTATVAGIDVYRREFPQVPIIGVVPVVKTASETSTARCFAVLSTRYTARSPYQRRLIRTFAAGCRIYNIGCTNLVSLVEQGILTGRRVRSTLRNVLQAGIAGGIDTIALGCTHYPFLRPEIRAIVGESVRILDSGGAVARHVSRILDKNNMRAKRARATHEFITTGSDSDVTRVAGTLVGMSVEFRHVAI